MILRRPKKQASSENAPGPSKVIAMTMASGFTPNRLVSEELHSGFNKRIAMPTSAETEPAKGVKRPKIKEVPIISASRPGAHIPLPEVCDSINQAEA